MRIVWVAAALGALTLATGCGAFTAGATEPFRVSEPYPSTTPAGTAWGTMTGNYSPVSIDLRHFDETRLLAKYWGGKLMAVSLIPHYVLKTFVQPDIILPLTSYAKTVSPSYFYPSVWSQGVENGVRYRIGGQVKVSEIIYSQEAFQKAGITHAPATWAAFQRDLAKVKGTVTVPFEMAAVPADIEAVILSNGGSLPGRSGPSAAFTAAATQTFGYFRTLYRTGLLQLAPDAQLLTDIADGRTAAISASSPMYLEAEQQAKQNGISLGVFQYPAGSSGHRANVARGSELTMFTHHSPATQAQAWAFIQWFDAAKQQAYYAEQTGYGPVTPKAVPLISKKTLQQDPSLQLTIRALQSPYTTSSPGISGYGAVKTALATQFTNAVTRQTSVAAAVAAVDSAARQDL